jgi:Ca2+-binding RTX toxin-like protein
LGDNGEAIFDDLATLREARATAFGQGGDDILITGNGFDLVIGGLGDDVILAGGDDYARDLVAGDSAEVLLDAAEVLIVIRSLASALGGNDRITTGYGSDVVIAGAGNDLVLATSALNAVDLPATLALVAAGRFDELDAGDDARDLVVGDNGEAFFDARDGQSLLREIRTSDPADGGNDLLITGNGFDVVIGGVGNDVILAGGDDAAPIRSSATMAWRASPPLVSRSIWPPAILSTAAWISSSPAMARIRCSAAATTTPSWLVVTTMPPIGSLATTGA